MKESTPTKPLAEPRGLVCSQCGCRHFEVVYTRQASGERIIRRRACRNCGRRISTVERRSG
jgi:transcriptional regulator NrdR family protein